MSANSAKKRKRSDAGDTVDRGVLPSSKVQKVDDVPNQKEGIQKTYVSRRGSKKVRTRENKRGQNVRNKLKKATPEKLRTWRADLPKLKGKLADIQKRVANSADQAERHALNWKQRKLHYRIEEVEEVLRRCEESQPATKAATPNAVGEEKSSDADDESNSSDESVSDVNSEDENGDDPESSVCHKSESAARLQSHAQSAHQPPALPSGCGAVPTAKLLNPKPVGIIHIPVRALGAVIGPTWRRLQQIERESCTRITIADLRSGSVSPRECRIYGTDHGIAKATRVIDRLLNYEKQHEEERRLDAAVKDHHLLYPMEGPPQPSRPQPQAQTPKMSSSIEAVRKRLRSGGSAEARQKPSSLPAPKKSQMPQTRLCGDIMRPEPSTSTSVLPRKRMSLTSDSESDTSSSSGSPSDEEQPASSPVPLPALSKRRPQSTSSDSIGDETELCGKSKTSQSGTAPSIPSRAVPLAHRPRTPQPRSPHSAPAERPPAPPTAPASTPFQVPAGSAVVKIEDDSDEEQEPSPRSQTPPALRRAHDFGIVPVNNMVTLAEFEEILSMKETEKGKLEYKLKVLEYALHFKGVSDPQILRLMSRSGTVDGKKTWDPKFEGILGHPRQGRASDGRPLRREDR